jgi:hypothetical protein
MKKKDPGKVDKKGYGEMGRIYEQFFISEARFSRGIAISGSPWYSQKLWDDDADNDGESDSILGAPTVRSVADVGMAVAANFIAPGVGGALVSAALNMVDDAIFTALDVANGAASAGDAWGGFAKKGAISMGTTLTGGAFNGFGDSLGGFMETGLSDMSFFQDSLIASTALKATELTTNLTYTNAVHAVGWDGGLSFDQKAFAQGFQGPAAWAGVVAGTAGHFVNNGLNTFARGYINDTHADMTTLNRTAGNLAGSAIEYGMTGSATYNVARIYGTGALEMHLGGDGPMFNLGRSGYNMDYETLMQSMQGFDGYRQNARIAKSSVDDDYIAAMRMSYSSGGTDSQTRALYEQLLSGAAVIEKGSEGTARSKMENGIRTVYMDELSGRNSDLHYGVVLSHEAMRNGLDDGEEGQLRETWQAVLQHSLVAQSVGAIYGDDSLTGDMQQEVELLQEAIESGDFSAFGEHALSSYDSTQDYWKLMDNGEVAWDGKKDLTNEAGETVRVDKTGSYSKSLLNWLGKENAISQLMSRGIDAREMSESEIAQQLMKTSGVEWDSSAYSDTTGKNTGAYVPTALPGGQSANMTGLDDRLRFQLSENDAFNLGKISQESPEIAYYVENDKGEQINAMAITGCYYMSTLGGVQTQSGQLLTAEQINTITEASLENGWLKADGNSIYPTGDNARRNISQLAFSELGEFGYLDFSNNPNNADGSLIVGETVHGNNHAREGNNYMNSEIFDPYEGISYQSGQDIVSQKSKYYEYVDYQKYYWQQYEEYYK